MFLRSLAPHPSRRRVMESPRQKSLRRQKPLLAKARRHLLQPCLFVRTSMIRRDRCRSTTPTDSRMCPRSEARPWVAQLRPLLRSTRHRPEPTRPPSPRRSSARRRVQVQESARRNVPSRPARRQRFRPRPERRSLPSLSPPPQPERKPPYPGGTPRRLRRQLPLSKLRDWPSRRTSRCRARWA